MTTSSQSSKEIVAPRAPQCSAERPLILSRPTESWGALTRGRSSRRVMPRTVPVKDPLATSFPAVNWLRQNR